ncbi:MAG: hypothetical protein ACK4Z9_03140, partial [Thermodesulfovibrionales bacterium]
ILNAILYLLTFNFLIFSFSSPVLALTDKDIISYQREIENRDIGERIAFWAEKFIGIPYDPDPLGDYVTKKVIVNDEKVDCMYLSFRTLELALSRTPEEAVEIALDKRFITRGVMREGRVLNYDERFQYGEDMLDSGKWGKDITPMLGRLSYIKGSRGRKEVAIISKEDMLYLLRERENPLKDGDFIYFVKFPNKRSGDEIVGHIGIIKKEEGKAFLVHASGNKNKGGIVKKIPLIDYLESMPFAGIRIGRFTDP